VPRYRELGLEIRRNRVAIQAWLRRMAEAGNAPEEMDNEAAGWYRALPEEQRLRLESDVARLTLDLREIETIASGPLGELIGRFAGLIQDHRGPTEEAGPNPSEVDEIVTELGKLGQVDPSWLADWEAFEESLEAPEPPTPTVNSRPEPSPSPESPD